MTAVLVTIIILLLIAVYLAVFRFGLHNLLIRQSGDRTGSIIWEDMGADAPWRKKIHAPGSHLGRRQACFCQYLEKYAFTGI